jgi:hypothetical protein
MNARYIISAVVFFAIGLVFFASQSSYNPFVKSNPLLCVYTKNQLGMKDQLVSLYTELKTIDISKKQIVENPATETKSVKVKLFFDQEKFNAISPLDNSVLNVAIGLKNSFENDEHAKIVGIFDQDKILGLVELVQKLLPNAKEFLVVYNGNHNQSLDCLKKINSIMALKSIKLHECKLDKRLNLATQLKDISKTVQAVIFLPDDLVFQESELIFEHFKSLKIPVFANHVGLIKSGALAGFAYDIQDVAYAITQLISEYLESNCQVVNDDLLAELMPQLHVNMDVLKHIGINIADGLLDEAVTVGGSDL